MGGGHRAVVPPPVHRRQLAPHRERAAVERAIAYHLRVIRRMQGATVIPNQNIARAPGVADAGLGQRMGVEPADQVAPVFAV